MSETRVYNQPINDSNAPTESPITALSAVVAGRTAIHGERQHLEQADAEGAMGKGADLLAIGRAPIVDPEWLQKVQRGEETYPEGLPLRRSGDCRSAGHPRADGVSYLLSRPGWFPRA